MHGNCPRQNPLKQWEGEGGGGCVGISLKKCLFYRSKEQNTVRSLVSFA